MTGDARSATSVVRNGSERLLAEVGRFLTVGGVATFVALVIFNALVHGFSIGNRAILSDRPVLAYVLANSVGMMISYRGARSWAFRDRPPRHPDGGRAAYVLINLVTMSLPIACLTVSRDVLGLDDPLSDNISANVIGLALGLGARFYLFRRFVFRRPVTPPHHVTQGSAFVRATGARGPSACTPSRGPGSPR